MYVLVATALVALGGGAAQALFFAHDLGDKTAVMDCLSDQGLTSAATQAARTSATSDQIAACTEESNVRQGVGMLVGSVATLAVVWLLMLGGGLVTRVRLRWGRTALASTVAGRTASDRFDMWCDVWQLKGRRRPRLLLTAPGSLSGQAFTTGLPFTRPWVAVPVSYAYAEPGQFDLVVLHELAHVRARDLLWTSAVWWSGWLGVPMLLAALGPFLARPSMLQLLYGKSLILAAVLSVVVLLLRVALLRRRELLADSFATGVLGGHTELRTAFGVDPGGAAPLQAGTSRSGVVATIWTAGVRVRRLGSTHPAPAVRVDLPQEAADASEGGFVVSALAGMVAMYGFQYMIVVLSDVLTRVPHEARIPSDVGLVLAAVLWAGVLVPAWVRRARAVGNKSPRWWGPAFGAAAGVVGGYAAQIPGGASVSDDQFGENLTFVCLILAVVTVGVAVLAMCLAVSVSAGRRGWAIVLATATAASASAATWSVTTTVMSIATMAGTSADSWSVNTTILSIRIVNKSAAQDRAILASMGGHYGNWRFLAPGLLLVLGLTALAARAPRQLLEPLASRGSLSVRIRASGHVRVFVAVMLPAIVLGGLSGGVSWLLRFQPGMSDGLIHLFVHQRWWACALAGWAVMAVLLLTHAGRGSRVGLDALPPTAGTGFPGALIAGFVTAALAGAVTFLSAAAGGFGYNLATLSYSVEMPMWLLFVTTIVTLPAVFLTIGVIRRFRAWRVAPARMGMVSLGTTVLLGTLIAALYSGGLAAVAVGPDDWSSINAASSQPDKPTQPAALPSPSVPSLDPNRAADPARPLDNRTTETVLASVTPLLPAGFEESTPAPHAGLMQTTPARCGELFAADTNAENDLPRTGNVVRRYSFTPEPNISMTITVSVTSFTSPRPNLAMIRDEVAQCPSFAWPWDGADDRLLHCTLTKGAALPLTHQSFRYDQFIFGAAGGRLTKSTTAGAHVLVGHNQIVVTVTYTYTDKPPTEAVPQYAEQLVNTAPAAIIVGLRTVR